MHVYVVKYRYRGMTLSCKVSAYCEERAKAIFHVCYRGVFLSMTELGVPDGENA